MSKSGLAGFQDGQDKVRIRREQALITFSSRNLKDAVRPVHHSGKQQRQLPPSCLCCISSCHPNNE